ncbi:hypothetical protein [Yersinia enterocolitica]|nr:hypothetical protein [Yersinia enterocolitica]
MDEYVSEFCAKYYVDDNPHRDLLLWLLINKRNDSGRINQKLFREIDKGKDITNPIYNSHIKRYKDVYDRQGKRNTAAVTKKSIYSLQIANFRGFGQLNGEDLGITINFNAKNNIFFAPNGGGKTSLCEAIEYYTTGNIKEAGRRKTSIKNYITRNGKPLVKILNNNKLEISTDPVNIFNFIDRNRLQEFSLLGSNDTKFNERDVLAALVGLEGFDLAISTLVQPKSFNLNTIKKNENITKHSKYVDEFNIFKKDHKQSITQIDNVTKNIISYAKIINTPERNQNNAIRYIYFRAKKTIAHMTLAKEKYKKGVVSIIIDTENSYKLIKHIRFLIENKIILDSKLLSLSSKVDYLSLYQSAKNVLSKISYDKCPLCLTNIKNTQIDPLKNSQNGIDELKNLSCIQLRKNKTTNRMEGILNNLRAWLNKLLTSPINTYFDASKIIEIVSKLQLENIEILNEQLEEILLNLEKNPDIKIFNEKAAIHNRSILDVEKTIKRIDGIIEKNSRLINYIDERSQEKIDASRSKKAQSQKIALLIKSMNEKKPLVKIDTEFNDFIDELTLEYQNFYIAAYEFKRRKEGEILSGIEASIITYYNNINKHDDNSEKLNRLYFSYEESSKSYRIQMEINNESVDAFVFLSEGHLKSLGLAILLALAKKKKSQFIVFDDVVNAIDTEHRANIINTFLTDDFLKNTQKIITTHDKLFWEMYSNKSKEMGNGEFSSFILNSYPHGIYIVEKKISFEDKIKESLACYDLRQALIYCRIWFESLASHYCVNAALTITGSFSSREYQKPNYIKVSLESMYNALNENLGENLENVNLIRRNLINWSLQNQEHHAFSEHNYNITHSKTSAEIQEIFDCIRKFEIQLNPQIKLQSLSERAILLDGKIQKQNIKLANPNVAVPIDTLRLWTTQKLNYEQDRIKVGELIDYCRTLIPQVPAIDNIEVAQI